MQIMLLGFTARKVSGSVLYLSAHFDIGQTRYVAEYCLN